MTLALPQCFATNWYYFQHHLSIMNFFLQSSEIRSAPPAAVRQPILVATMSWPLGVGEGKRESPGNKMSQTPLLLLRLSSVLLNCLSICCLPLVNFQSTEMVVFDNFTRFYHCFFEPRPLPRSCFRHLPSFLTPLYEYKFLLPEVHH